MNSANPPLTLKADAESLWTILSDAVDEILGIKNRPDRLLKIANAVITCLIFSVIFIYAKLPTGRTQELDWRNLRVSLWPRDVVENSVLLAKSRNAVTYLLGGFIILLLVLSFLINAVGSASIRAQQTAQTTETAKKKN